MKLPPHGWVVGKYDHQIEALVETPREWGVVGIPGLGTENFARRLAPKGFEFTSRINEKRQRIVYGRYVGVPGGFTLEAFYEEETARIQRRPKSRIPDGRPSSMYTKEDQ